jgi:ABC-type transporter Mla maintaining outer membrane lipid asymmetry ATPase subunit MlaF
MSADTHKPAVPAIDMRDVDVSSLQDLENVVLQNVNWTVAAGEYWAVAGMHGSGKSDLLSLAAGLMPPKQGTYHLFGHPMPIFEDALLPNRLRAALVFESGKLFHHLTVAENIALPLRYHRDLDRRSAVDRLHELLTLTELDNWADSTPGALGRYWQKRVGLARALILEPELLLLDNPLGGLDIRHTNWWLNFLSQLSAGHELFGNRRMTLVATVEDLRPWRSRATHFAVLKENKFNVLGARPSLSGDTEVFVRELLSEESPQV